MCVGYAKMRDSLYPHVVIWVNTILNHVDTRATSPRYESLAWLIDLKGIENKITRQIHICSIGVNF